MWDTKVQFHLATLEKMPVSYNKIIRINSINFNNYLPVVLTGVGLFGLRSHNRTVPISVVANVM